MESKEELEKEFPITFEDERNEEEERWKEYMGENMKYVERLEEGPFSFSKEGFKAYLNGYGRLSRTNVKCFNNSNKNNKCL